MKSDPPINLALVAKLVWGDKVILRDIAISSVTITILSLVPILLVMRTISAVLQYQSKATLDVIIVILITVVTFEMLLTWGRKMMEVILAAKLDSRLNLIIFDRLMALPIEFFERQRAGELTYKMQQINRVREFLTGKLMNTFIDVMMLTILLPVVFFINATLAWTVLVAAALIAVIIGIFLRPLGHITGKIITAEIRQGLGPCGSRLPA